ncbi:MAG TPA: hypothetical protein PKC30_12955 [Saprospiraceae bacterium]|nr:hypothetical protein [Saprospiraceae bacterium]
MIYRIAKLISIVAHPLFILFYMLSILLMSNPYLFGMQDRHHVILLLITTFMLTTFFPGLSIILMRVLGLVESLHMKSRHERTGPLIVTAIFYLWLYINIKDNTNIPGAFTFVVFGTVIAVFLSFFINIFQKISLHGVGMGGFLFGIFIIASKFSYGSFLIEFPLLGVYQVSMILILALVFLITGMVLSSRLLLGIHTRQEIFGGLFIGMFSQFFALMLVT